MAKSSNLKAGDRIAYTAKFLKSTGQFTGSAGARRGTFLKHEGQFARVRWDDEAEMLASEKGQYAESDYCDEIRKNGSLVFAGNIARVGSAKFALNDM